MGSQHPRGGSQPPSVYVMLGIKHWDLYMISTRHTLPTERHPRPLARCLRRESIIAEIGDRSGLWPWCPEEGEAAWLTRKHSIDRGQGCSVSRDLLPSMRCHPLKALQSPRWHPQPGTKCSNMQAHGDTSQSNYKVSIFKKLLSKYTNAQHKV